MRFDIVTLFPDIIGTYVKYGIVGKAVSQSLIDVHTHDLREYGEGSYRKVDDRPFGGGAGMVLMFDPIAKCLQAVKSVYDQEKIINYQVIATTAKGESFKQSIVRDYKDRIVAERDSLQAMVILCGRYEGFDQRILDELVDKEYSIGNFVLTGGELPALTIVDSITRLLPGALSKSESYAHDSFYEDDKTVQYPQYTRPEVIEYNSKQLKVPEELLSGHHENIEKWREEQKRKI
jgi:tRNA (guanine37-N1)-methyltransferase